MKHPKMLKHIHYYQDNPNFDLDFIDKFPNYELSLNSQIKLAHKLKFEDACADPVKYSFFFKITDNPAITLDMIKNNPQYPWDTDFYVYNPHAQWEDILEIKHTKPELFSANENINMRIILENPHIKWKYNRLSSNASITLDDIDKNSELPWSWGCVIMRKDITLEFAKKYKHKTELVPEMDIEGTLEYQGWHEDLNIELVRKYKDKKLCWQRISRHDGITMDDIRNNPDLPWNLEGISRNANMTIEYLLENLDKNLDWFNVSYQKNITMQMVIDHPECPWDYEGLSLNPNLTAEFLFNNIDKEWVFHYISENTFKKE